MNQIRRIIAVFLVLGAFHAHADIIQFDDFAAWNAAAGSPSFQENFSSFAGDTSFFGASLQLTGFSVEAMGTVQADLNIIDVSPFESRELVLNGTSYLLGGVDFSFTTIDVIFDFAVSAFGGFFEGADGPEQLLIDVLGSGGGVLATLDPVSDFTYLGFVANAGEQIAGLRLFAGTNRNDAREAFGFDGAAGVYAVTSVPEPGTLALLGIGLAGMGLARRRKKV